MLTDANSMATGIEPMKTRLLISIVSLFSAIAICAAALALLANHADWPPGHQRIVVSWGGRNREFLLYVPPLYENSKAVPLVVMLHGMGGTAMNSHKETSWSSKAEAEMFIVAYPEATRPDPKSPPSLRNNPQAWNDGSGRFHASERDIDDVGFIRAMLDRITADYNIDSKRIYVAGFSNGASMTFRVGAELTNRIAAISPNAGACWTKELKLSGGLSLCYITGTSDTLNPIDGGYPKLVFGGKNQDGPKKPPVQETIDKWVKALGGARNAESDITTDGVRTRRYGTSHQGAEVEYITIEGLGHHWAGGTSQAPEFLVGKNTEKLKATDVVWDFFVKHPKE